MWPFKKKKVLPKPGRMVKQVVTGVIIGGAIGSIIGKKMMEKHANEKHEGKDEDENGFSQTDV